MKNVLFALFLVSSLSLQSQAQPGKQALRQYSAPDVKISQLKHTLTLNQFTLVAIDSSCASGFQNIPPSLFTDGEGQDFDDGIPLKNTRYPYYFSFRVVNDTKDTASLFVYSEPQRSIQLCATSDQGATMNCLELQHDSRFFVEQQFFNIIMLPQQTQRYVLRIEFPETRFSYLRFWIGPYERYVEFVWFHFGLTSSYDVYDCIFVGMIAMMFIYMLSKYIQIRKLEYLYYAAYTFLFLLFFIIKLLEMLGVPEFYSSSLLYSLGYRLTQLLAYWMYYLFIQQFLNTKTAFPRAHKLMNVAIACIVGFAVVELVMFFIPQTYVLRWQLWDIVRIILALTGLSFTISFIFIGNMLSRYLVAGGTALAFFGMLSMLFTAYPELNSDWPELFNNGLSYFEMGIMLELLFFALGLGHKNKMDELEKAEAKEALKLAEERQHIKHLHAMSEVQERERSRFAKDLHDGLGGMLWGIKLSLSTMKSNMILSSDQVPVFERSLDMLDNSIHELRRVAHNLMPEALVKFGLTAALKDFCDFVNSSKVINVIFQQVGNERRLDISIEVVLYRVINELANNALRHSSASELLIQLNYSDEILAITIEDNGVGFDKSILSKTTGAGWPNIKSRIEYLKGSVDIETSIGNGTAVNITIPI